MKDLLRSLIADEADAVRARNRAREYLQARILLALQDHGAFADWAFMGGTALRFLFRLPRYSEDLDFSLASPDRAARFQDHLRAVKFDLTAEAYTVEVRVRDAQTVAAAMVSFRGLLYDLGLSPHRDETMAVKVELDTRPPEGAGLATQVVRRHFLLNMLHYDKPSLLAGKLHAVLSRKFTKGRDLYDLAWYLSDRDWPPPNLVLLNHALRQTGGSVERLEPTTWRGAIAARLRNLNWERVRADVSPFLERQRDAALLEPATFFALLEGVS